MGGTGVVNDVFLSEPEMAGQADSHVVSYAVGTGVERSKDGWDIGTIPVGTRLYIELYSERIVYNDDGEYYLPTAITRWRPMRWMRMTMPFSCRLP